MLIIESPESIRSTKRETISSAEPEKIPSSGLVLVEYTPPEDDSEAYSDEQYDEMNDDLLLKLAYEDGLCEEVFNNDHLDQLAREGQEDINEGLELLKEVDDIPDLVDGRPHGQSSASVSSSISAESVAAISIAVASMEIDKPSAKRNVSQVSKTLEGEGQKWRKSAYVSKESINNTTMLPNEVALSSLARASQAQETTVSKPIQTRSSLARAARAQASAKEAQAPIASSQMVEGSMWSAHASVQSQEGMVARESLHSDPRLFATGFKDDHDEDL